MMATESTIRNEKNKDLSHDWDGGKPSLSANEQSRHLFRSLMSPRLSGWMQLEKRANEVYVPWHMSGREDCWDEQQSRDIFVAT